MNDTLGIIMAGNSGPELGEITSSRPIGAVPVASRYRLVDFILSNMVNSGIDRVGIPTQTHYRSLMDHLGSGAAWDLNRKRHGLVVLPPYMSYDAREMRGDLDVLNSIMDYITASNRKYVLLSGSDFIFNTTFDSLAAFHKENDADITLMYYTAPPNDRHDRHIGVQTDQANRITDIEINASRPFSDQVSMGIYFMERDFLEYHISRCLSRGLHDFASDVLQKERQKLKIFGFEYSGYAGRVHNIQSFFRCNMDMLSPEISAQLFDGRDPVYTKVKDKVPTIYGEEVVIKNSMVADGCIINGTVENSIIFRGVQIEKGAVVKNSIIMQDSFLQAGAWLENTILDKSVIIRKNKRLIGQENYPVTVEKNAVV